MVNGQWSMVNGRGLVWRFWGSLAAMVAMIVLLACSAPAQPAAEGPATATPRPTPPPEGSITPGSFYSPVLEEDIHYYVYLPAGYEAGSERFPVLYLLHGRGENMADWAKVKADLDRLIAAGEIPQLIAILPDAPWSRRASYYVDSQYTGPDNPGRPVESAFVNDLIPHVDTAYRTIPEREGRAIAGYSMGGYGALRYALAHADLFLGAILLSPAIYVPLPPAGSSTREFGAFGLGQELFDEAIWSGLNYPSALEGFQASGLKTRLFIAVGDDEYKHPDPAERLHDLDMEAHMLYNVASRIRGLFAELRVLDGGHDWGVWRPGFMEGLRYLAPFLKGPRVELSAES